MYTFSNRIARIDRIKTIDTIDTLRVRAMRLRGRVPGSSADMQLWGGKGTTPVRERLKRRQHSLRAAAHLVGIDLGTTNSSVAVLGEGGPEVIVVDEASGRRSVPSVVALSPGGGAGLSLQSWETSQGAVFYSFKRIIGLQLAEILPTIRDSLRYEIRPDLAGMNGKTPGCVVSYGETTTTPVALSTAVVRHLMDVSAAYHGDSKPIAGAVVAVPAHFTPSQKQATIDAVRGSGVDNVHLLQEPVAAALAYGIDGGSDGETVLVFDWGGGTFDVSVLQAFEGIMEILGTDGNQFLGGDDIDQLLVEWAGSLCHDACDTGDAGDRPGGERDRLLRSACRTAKEALAEVGEARIYVENVVDTMITRDDLELVCKPLFAEIATVLDRIGKDLFIEWNTDPFEAISRDSSPDMRAGDGAAAPWAPPPRIITKVALVGQITRLNMVVDYIRRVTGVTPDCSVDPGEAVAIGAATQAGILDGSVGSVELMDGSYSVDLHDRTTGFTNWQP
jgi:heat shock 70kDa protein 1/2/6/8